MTGMWQQFSKEISEVVDQAGKSIVAVDGRARHTSSGRVSVSASATGDRRSRMRTTSKCCSLDIRHPNQSTRRGRLSTLTPVFAFAPFARARSKTLSLDTSSRSPVRPLDC